MRLDPGARPRTGGYPPGNETVNGTDAGEDNGARMVKWLAQEESNTGTTYIGRNTDGRKIKVFAPNDGRQRARFWQWDRKRKLWIEKISATGGYVNLPVRAKVARDLSLLPVADPRDARTDWSAIRKTKTGWITNKPEFTKRTAAPKVREVRGQRGNRQATGS